MTEDEDCAQDALDIEEALDCVERRIKWYEARRKTAPPRTLRAADLLRRMVSVAKGANADELARMAAPGWTQR